jgi:hypothetical protein
MEQEKNMDNATRHLIDSNKARAYEDQKKMRNEIKDFAEECSVFNLSKVYSLIKDIKRRNRMDLSLDDELKKMKDTLKPGSDSKKQKIYVLRFNEYDDHETVVTGWKKISVRAETLDDAIAIGNKHFADKKNIKYREYVCNSTYAGFTEFYGDLEVINVNQNGVNK